MTYNRRVRRIEFDENDETVLDKDTGYINTVYRVARLPTTRNINVASYRLPRHRIEQGHRYGEFARFTLRKS